MAKSDWSFRTTKLKKYNKLYCIKNGKLKRTLIVPHGAINKTKDMVRGW